MGQLVMSLSKCPRCGQPLPPRLQPTTVNALDEFGRWHDVQGRVVVGWINPKTGALMPLPNGHKPYDHEPAWEVVYGS